VATYKVFFIYIYLIENLWAPEASFDMQDITREEVRHIHGSRAPGDAGGDQEDVLPWVSLSTNIQI
jgi:hypothetical protein